MRCRSKDLLCLGFKKWRTFMLCCGSYKILGFLIDNASDVEQEVGPVHSDGWCCRVCCYRRRFNWMLVFFSGCLV